MARVSSLAEARARRRSGDSPGESTALLPDDDQLALAVRNGDGRMAAFLFRRLEPAVRRAVRRLSGPSPADAEDLVQVAFERIVIGLKKGQFRTGANLEAWATVIATRVGIDHLRSHYRRRRVFSSSEPPDASGALSDVEARAELLEVRKALSRLKRSHAEVVFMHDAMGYSLAEIAAQLDISLAAAQSRLVRTRKALVRLLKKQERTPK